ncbi:Uncharacterised protein [Serratia quinivorans]|nr:Uncharacterised protein [Serratia quinivorans]
MAEIQITLTVDINAMHGVNTTLQWPGGSVSIPLNRTIHF